MGGAAHVERDSSLEFVQDIKFLDNTASYLTHPFWVRHSRMRYLLPFVRGVFVHLPVPSV